MSLDLPSPPFVHVDGIANFRDIGGWALRTATPSSSDASTPAGSDAGACAADPAALLNGGARSVRRGVFFRAGDPTTVTPRGKAQIQRLGITTVFDLRSRPEIERYGKTRGPVPVIDGVERVYAPVFEMKDVSPEAMAWGYQNYLEGGPEGFKKAYREILDAFPPSLTLILAHIIRNPDAGVLAHCSAGKDRTGVLTALLLSIAGVSDEDIAAEYELTEQGLVPMKEVLLGVLLKDARLAEDPEGVERMISAKKENMLAVLQMVRDEYGGFEAYVKRECSLSDDDIQTLRQNLTSDEPPIH